jgi:hypothetical protein
LCLSIEEKQESKLQELHSIQFHLQYLQARKKQRRKRQVLKFKCKEDETNLAAAP